MESAKRGAQSALLATLRASRTALSVLFRPFAGKNLHCGPGQVHVVVGFRPEETQIATGKMRGDAPRRAPGQNAGDGHCTSAGAAGQRLARTTFPNPDRNVLRPVDANKLDVGA